MIYAAIEFFSIRRRSIPISTHRLLSEADLRSGHRYPKLLPHSANKTTEYQIIFGVRDERDLCVEVVKKSSTTSELIFVS